MWWQWAALVAGTAGLLTIDVVLVRPRSLRAAAWASAAWAAAGFGFAGVMWAWRGPAAAGEYLAGYTIERSLSLDNVFVLLVVLSAFAVPPALRPRAVAWAIAAALALRAVFILGGTALLGAAAWTAYPFAAFLIVTGLRLARTGAAEPDPVEGRMMRALRRVVPIAPRYQGTRLVVRHDRRLHATPLLAVMLVLAATDVAFAADSIPSILAVTRDPLIVFAANAMALLGLPPLFVLLEGMRDRCARLNLGLAAVLVLTGAEMAVADLYHPPAWATLAAVAGLIGASIAASPRPPAPVPATSHHRS